ncbi:16S rRNA (adenine(1518)-N(6)/adenine(1519)-N(6))-dimethyltransferase [Corynebacterium yudongzhengii]|uniref:Ribosomal RNA small subunit methyltransferase A n=1 Tax=Corynebacterium yudongzhengii TaxID=2080740 RepID=A0A2U1T7Z9_9CORY|nr:16S rRNA (adenine(1518)-N(6)/adenine(1519)-N(6))-dimethyltransferase RsmA [Corynebacterium yudongzhengii]AWB82286.1 16S rRNA (adenine(1518)-N(6)/adenine(1519)-N(6))-dimethyltransferase [Corynebacterium yudongzhengii]PWC02095.1 16S rRNA (adenine(1518)-N(6)/adenine(1519)-N(6))-dimethyltransferase RsmA [Corynebacterium yudongzhengii]
MTNPEAHLLGPADIRALADELGVVPTKKLGQNFVHDPNTVRRIVAAAELSRDDHVVEIGPGLGSLTLGLLEAADRVTAVEIDERLAARLELTARERAAGLADKLTVLHRNALEVAAEEIDTPTALVANLPYNVSVPVLLHFLQTFPTITRVLVMVQAEVADRLAAAPGSKIYGVPSVKAAFYGRVRKAGAIGRNVFWPAPNIDSGLVRIDIPDPKASWEVSEKLRSRLFPLIDAAFAQRRKTLRAALAGHYGSAPAAEEALAAAGIDPRQRGEKLSISDFVRLARTSTDHEENDS